MSIATAKAEDRFDLEAWPFYWMTKANGRYFLESEAALKQAGLDTPSWRVLMMLQGNVAHSIGYLSEHGAIKLPTMTKIIQRMQADGLVKSRPRASDARVTEVVLTEQGMAARAIAWTVANDVYATAFSGIADKDLGVVISVMRKILSNFAAKSGR
jgi:DNA-binding MarR family transcriptional regulator